MSANDDDIDIELNAKRWAQDRSISSSGVLDGRRSAANAEEVAPSCPRSPMFPNGASSIGLNRRWGPK